MEYEKIIEPLKKQNITAPDDLWLKVRGRLEKPMNPFFVFRFQLAALSLFLVMGVGIYSSYQNNPQIQANRYLKESLKNNIYSEYTYFHDGTF